ncbi:MAG: response regulator [Bacteroidetes bacterium]|nr:response regulator [Bacteroidota bacterium]
MKDSDLVISKQDIVVNLEGKTILVVDDIDINIELIKEILDGTNINIIEAHNGQQAINSCLLDQNIDVVLMDIQMPIMNGYEAMRQIKKLCPELPIIAQTAYAFAEDISKCMAAGFNDYIAKPFDQNKLIEILLKNFN